VRENCRFEIWARADDVEVLMVVCSLSPIVKERRADETVGAAGSVMGGERLGRHSCHTIKHNL
jgi:hypothetical protein